MSKFAFTLTIDRPAEEVFRALSEDALTSGGSVNVSAEHLPSRGSSGDVSGVRVSASRFGGGTSEVEVTTMEPRRIVMRGLEMGVPWSSAFELTPLDGSTRVDWQWDITPRGLKRPLGPMIAWLYKRWIGSELHAIKSSIESDVDARRS